MLRQLTQSVQQIKEDGGPADQQGRTWISRAIVDRRLAKYLGTFMRSELECRQFYEESGLLSKSADCRQDAGTWLHWMQVLERCGSGSKTLQRRVSTSALLTTARKNSTRTARGRTRPNSACSYVPNVADPEFNEQTNPTTRSTSSLQDQLDAPSYSNYTELHADHTDISHELEEIASTHDAELLYGDDVERSRDLLTPSPNLEERSVELARPALLQTYQTSHELEKENAHFAMSEAIIQAIEEQRNKDLVPKKPSKVASHSRHRQSLNPRSSNRCVFCCIHHPACANLLVSWVTSCYPT